MPRRIVLLLLGGCAAAVIGVFVAAAVDERRLAFTLGVRANAVIELPAGAEGCQGPIGVSADFATVEVGLGTYFKPGPEMTVSVRDVESNDVLGRGALPAGYGDNEKHVVRIGAVSEGPMVAVCFRNEGTHKVAVYAGKPEASNSADASSSAASVDGAPRPYDMDIVFYRSERASLLSLVPDIFDRAAMWLPGPVRGWIIWALLATVVFVVPALLLRALARV